jgi:hypothetical protein
LIKPAKIAILFAIHSENQGSEAGIWESILESGPSTSAAAAGI